MAKSCPELIEPIRLADQGLELSGSYPLTALERIAPLLHQPEGAVIFTLRFSRISTGERIVQGEVHAVLSLICQRCLRSMDFSVDQKVRLGVVQSLAEADLLSGEFEPLLVEGQISMRDLIEDELLLALPVVVRHELNECPARVFLESNPPEKFNPFVQLKINN